MNSKLQGNVGLGQAIAHFTALGYSISIPLTESQRYDLIVDDGDKLYRVEVKTTKGTTIALRTLGGNQSWSGEVKRISAHDCDLVFCYSIAEGDSYLFPVEVVEGRSTIALCEKYAYYKL